MRVSRRDDLLGEAKVTPKPPAVRNKPKIDDDIGPTFLDETDMNFTFKVSIPFNDIDNPKFDRLAPLHKAINYASAEATSQLILHIEALPPEGTVKELQDAMWSLEGYGKATVDGVTVRAVAKTRKRKNLA